MSARYYALFGSLPPLPHFTQATRLPISELRLRQRRAMLDPAHERELQAAMELIRWQRQTPERHDAQAAALYRDFMTGCRNRELREFVEYRAGLRAIIAALRRQRRHEEADSAMYGFGRWNQLLRDRQHLPDFGLAVLYPWISRARGLLEAGDALGLETLLMSEVWSRLQRLSDKYPLRFEAVFAYMFRWDILARRIEFDADLARTRFAQLLTEVCGDGI
jgi:hypothetical protein